MRSVPFSKLPLPPLAAEVYAVDPVRLAAWTEHGLFRYELGPYPTLQTLHPPAMVARRFDPAAGAVTWTKHHLPPRRRTRRGCRTPARRPRSNPPASTASKSMRPRARCACSARRGNCCTPSPDFPPEGAAWHVVAAVAAGHFVLASSRGFDCWRVPTEAELAVEAAAARAEAERAAPARHSERRGLLAAVIASPENDLPRLVYADYLEETGDAADIARAEFIRLQCRIAERQRRERLVYDPSVPAELAGPADADLLRADALAAGFQDQWAAQLPKLAGIAWQFRTPFGVCAWRGFPQVAATSAATLHKLRARILENAPADCVKLDHVDGEGFDALLRSPLLPRLRVPELSLMYGTAALRDSSRAGFARLVADPAAGALARADLQQPRRGVPGRAGRAPPGVAGVAAGQPLPAEPGRRRPARAGRLAQLTPAGVDRLPRRRGARPPGRTRRRPRRAAPGVTRRPPAQPSRNPARSSRSTIASDSA